MPENETIHETEWLMSDAEEQAWDDLWDTDAARSCSCPSCNFYAPDYEQHRGEPCLLRTIIRRIVTEQRTAWESAVLRHVVTNVPACRETPDFLHVAANAMLAARQAPSDPPDSTGSEISIPPGIHGGE